MGIPVRLYQSNLLLYQRNVFSLGNLDPNKPTAIEVPYTSIGACPLIGGRSLIVVVP